MRSNENFCIFKNGGLEMRDAHDCNTHIMPKLFSVFIICPIAVQCARGLNSTFIITLFLKIMSMLSGGYNDRRQERHSKAIIALHDPWVSEYILLSSSAVKIHSWWAFTFHYYKPHKTILIVTSQLSRLQFVCPPAGGTLSLNNPIELDLNKVF